VYLTQEDQAICLLFISIYRKLDSDSYTRVE